MRRGSALHEELHADHLAALKAGPISRNVITIRR